MHQKLIGICACSTLVTAIARLAIPRIDVAADIYVPVIYSFFAIVASVAVYMEKRWGYWSSLFLSGLQLFAVCYTANIVTEDYSPVCIDLVFNNIAVIISFVAASLLIKK